jgi:hypothetical protein
MAPASVSALIPSCAARPLRTPTNTRRPVTNWLPRSCHVPVSSRSAPNAANECVQMTRSWDLRCPAKDDEFGGLPANTVRRGCRACRSRGRRRCRARARLNGSATGGFSVIVDHKDDRGPQGCGISPSWIIIPTASGYEFCSTTLPSLTLTK